jgi:type II secretory pathway component PulC
MDQPLTVFANVSAPIIFHLSNPMVWQTAIPILHLLAYFLHLFFEVANTQQNTKISTFYYSEDASDTVPANEIQTQVMEWGL